MLLVLPKANQQVLALSFKALKAFLKTENNLNASKVDSQIRKCLNLAHTLDIVV
jgi:hypothetical protein